jgi:hypothetical protein
MKRLKVLGIHGISNHRAGRAPAEAAGEIAGWWAQALGNPGVEVTVGYYAHHLNRSVAQGAASLEPESQELVLAWARQLGFEPGTAQGPLTAPVRAGIEWVARRYGLDQRLVTLFIAKFCHEVHAYFTVPEVREAIAAQIRQTMAELEPDVVVAHSLGSVVAYEVLHSDPARCVETLITMGSPLAMPDIVFDRLVSPGGRHGKPPGVGRWINVADPGDIVAIPKGGISQRFEQVTADLTDAIATFDFHRATSYLRCGAVRGIIAGALPPA